MKKLLGMKGIKTVSLKETDGVVVNYAYTDDLLNKKIFIRFYEYEMGSDLEGIDIETAIFAFSVRDRKSYDISLFYDIGDIGVRPIALFRVILDLVEFISYCDEETVLYDLHNISSGDPGSDLFNGQDELYKENLKKYNLVLDLIQKERRSVN